MWWSEAAIQLFIVGSCTEKKFIFHSQIGGSSIAFEQPN